MLRVRFNSQIYNIVGMSRTAKITDFRKKIEEKSGIKPSLQRLFYMGKQLENGYTLYDYDIPVNGIIEMAEKVIFEKEKVQAVDSKENVACNGQVRSENESPASTTASSETVIRIEDIYNGNSMDLLESGPECDKCQDNPKKKCGECGCVVCQGKDNPNLNIMCDECEYAYHTYCLDPPLETVPDEEYWFCPECKNDSSEIINPGDKLRIGKKKAKTPSHANKSSRDWGRGMATAGRTKHCSKVPKNHFGPIPGIDVGMTWKFRKQVSEEGIHRPLVAGIAGTSKDGAYSIVLSGGYEDDVDYGSEFFYTGSGGRDLSGNKRTNGQSFDQELSKTNLALAMCCHAKVDSKNGGDAGTNWKKGKPVRVVRSAKLIKHSKYAPEEGCRYDGIYKVVRYWPEKGKSGFLVWRYFLRRDDEQPAPWTKEGKDFIAKNGYSCIYPIGYHEQMEEKKKNNETFKASAQNKRKTPLNVEISHQNALLKKRKTIYEMELSLKEMIQNEPNNQKQWQDILAKTYANKLEFTDEIEQEFKCPLCQYLVFKPITTNCEHNFCSACFDNMFKVTKACAICRKNLDESDTNFNESLFRILLKIFPGYGNGR